MNDMTEHAEKLLDSVLVSRAATAILTVVLVWLATRLVRRVVSERLHDDRTRYRARKVVGGVGWVVLALALAATFSDQLGNLALSFGVAGAGIAFALQEVIASIAGRVAVMFGGFYEVGQRVQLGGIKGDVIDIGLLRTTIMEVGDWVKGDLFTGRVVRVANSYVFKEPVFNYSGDFRFLWDEVTIPVKYGCDHRLARATLERGAQEITGGFVEKAAVEWKAMLAKYAVETARVEPMVTLVANDNWMEFTIRYVVPYTRRRTTKDELFTWILDEINASGGKLALASATFQLVEAPPIQVQLLGDPAAVRPPV